MENLEQAIIEVTPQIAGDILRAGAIGNGVLAFIAFVIMAFSVVYTMKLFAKIDLHGGDLDGAVACVMIAIVSTFVLLIALWKLVVIYFAPMAYVVEKIAN